MPEGTAPSGIFGSRIKGGISKTACPPKVRWQGQPQSDSIERTCVADTVTATGRVTTNEVDTLAGLPSTGFDAPFHSSAQMTGTSASAAMKKTAKSLAHKAA